MSDDNLRKILTSLALSSLISTADRDVFLIAIEQLGRKIGMETIDDLPISDWFHRERVLALEHYLVSIEDDDPALAAMLQDHLDKLKREGGISDPE